jgi:DNA-directed RNA polymerase alpha subunit
MDQEDLLDADLESSPAATAQPAEPSAVEGVGGDVSQRPVAELELSVRSRRIIDLLKIKTIGDLSSKTEAELLACPNFGQTSLNEIKAKLEELGLALKG